jgi:hypothetical protein
VTPVLAHGIGGIRDLPVPLWLFYYGGTLVLLLSFLALWALWTRPRLEQLARGTPVSPAIERIALAPATRIVLGAMGFGLLVLVAAASLVGDPSPTRNLAPTFIYVVFWLGVVVLVVLLGNVWAALNPWRAGADAVAWLSERSGFAWEPPLTYPQRLGRWPAAVLLLGFAALELAYTEPANPRALALAVYLYSAVTWFAMLAFGRTAWLVNGEAFSVYFGFLARLAPIGLRREGGRRRLVLRAPLAGVAVRDSRPGTVAFVAVMLGSVGFDGFSRTAWWQDRRFDLTSGLAVDSPRLADLVSTAFNLAGLIGVVVAVALAFLAAVRAAEVLSGSDRPLAGQFAGSLVPIALAYVVAHYFSLLVLQGQYVIPLASDPFGFGWDLFGTAEFAPNVAILSPNFVWYVQVGALVTGHVLGLVLAHDRAVSLFRSPRVAVATQYPLLTLMVLYTVGGMWLLSRG